MNESDFKEGDSIRWINGLGIQCSGTILLNEEDELVVVVDKSLIYFPISLFLSNNSVKKSNQ